MKFCIAFALLAACNHVAPPLAPTHNVAEDTALYAEPHAKCERGFDQAQLHSVRCIVPGGALVYCTASSTGFVCQPLNQQASPPEAKKPEAQPASSSTAGPAAAAPAPPAKPEAPKKK